MSELQMGAVELRFAGIIWQNGPIATGWLALAVMVLRLILKKAPKAIHVLG